MISDKIHLGCRSLEFREWMFVAGRNVRQGRLFPRNLRALAKTEMVRYLRARVCGCPSVFGLGAGAMTLIRKAFSPDTAIAASQ